MSYKILVHTSTRADFGLLRPVIKKLIKIKELEVRLVVTGGHLDPSQGSTISEIIASKIEINFQIDTSNFQDASQKISLGIKDFSNIINEIKPEALLILGDRYELYAAVIPAYLNRLKIFHIGGGENTLGSLDNGIRHSISMLSDYHFVSANQFKDELVQKSISEEKIYVVGALGASQISAMEFVPKMQLEQTYQLKFLKQNILITYHPNTTISHPIEELNELLAALTLFPHVNKIFSYSNLDAFGQEFNQALELFCSLNINALIIKSFGHKNYISLASHCDFVMGNSSSGLIEIPSINIPTLNIGDRQKNRLSGNSIRHCKASCSEIETEIITLLARTSASTQILNPYYRSRTVETITEVITKEMEKVKK